MRADVFLVERGHAATRSQAQRLIAGGLQWRLAPGMPWQKVAKNGDEIPDIAEVQLLDAIAQIDAGQPAFTTLQAEGHGHGYAHAGVREQVRGRVARERAQLAVARVTEVSNEFAAMLATREQALDLFVVETVQQQRGRRGRGGCFLYFG